MFRSILIRGSQFHPAESPRRMLVDMWHEVIIRKTPESELCAGMALLHPQNAGFLFRLEHIHALVRGGQQFIRRRTIGGEKCRAEARVENVVFAKRAARRADHFPELL